MNYFVFPFHAKQLGRCCRPLKWRFSMPSLLPVGHPPILPTSTLFGAKITYRRPYMALVARKPQGDLVSIVTPCLHIEISLLGQVIFHISAPNTDGGRISQDEQTQYINPPSTRFPPSPKTSQPQPPRMWQSLDRSQFTETCLVPRQSQQCSALRLQILDPSGFGSKAFEQRTRPSVCWTSKVVFAAEFLSTECPT
jgi:hypothetical protein